MNTFRAKRIADNLGELAIFDSEAAFWAFVFKLARASHDEDEVSEAEARLQA